MGSCSFSAPPRPPSSSISRITKSRCHLLQHPISLPNMPKTPLSNSHYFSSLSLINPASSSTQISATLRSPKGFGAPKRARKKKKTRGDNKEDEQDDDEEEEEEDEEERETQGIIPEIVTNRMMKRTAFSVGIPLSVGLMFFPLFYYLKVVLKIDVPNWVPFIVSFVFFGSALAGVSYGIVSSSWDPMREGSLLGWNEAQKNWPVFWQSFRGGGNVPFRRK